MRITTVTCYLEDAEASTIEVIPERKDESALEVVMRMRVKKEAMPLLLSSINDMLPDFLGTLLVDADPPFLHRLARLDLPLPPSVKEAAYETTRRLIDSNTHSSTGV